VIPRDCKRLAEVDFPIAEVSKHAAREKSIRHGHPSTLHLWWARRPLASCRAMLLALLWPDPCDPNCPEGFKQKARKLLTTVPGKTGTTDEDLRKALLKFIGDFANWDLSTSRNYLEVSRALVKEAYGEEPPLVVDPFAGGGSIPLEALRLGCDAFASDLNPVAFLVLKVILEDIPRHGAKLAEELNWAGSEIKKQAEKELTGFYPKDPDGAMPIAYLWARTVRCESPNCGAEIPLIRSFWLCKKKNRKLAIRHRITKSNGKTPWIEFDIFEPKIDEEVPRGTVTRANATCPCCGKVLTPERVRAQLSEQHGGADVVFDTQGNRVGGARLLALVTSQPGIQGRNYRLPNRHDYQPVWEAQKRLTSIILNWERGDKKGLCPIPDEPLPTARAKGSSGFRVLLYGMKTFGDLFSSRQKLAMTTITGLAATVDKGEAAGLLALSLDKLADFNSALARWAVPRETSAATFGRQALPMLWDYCETVPIGDSTGSMLGSISYATSIIDRLVASGLHSGQVQAAEASNSPIPDAAAALWFTDPPYYDSVAYADLSDFFLVWLKRTLTDDPLLAKLLINPNELSPKEAEAIQDPGRLVQGRSKDKHFYEEAMSAAFSEGRRVLSEEGLGCVVFAHKSTEGWEALISGIIRGGWKVIASWPITTERSVRLVAQETAALAASIHLVCRPRPESASSGDWAEVLRALPNRVGDWMERLQVEGIRGADLVFACIGPALEIFSQYKEVETADGREVKLAEYLEKVWEIVGRTALEQILGTEEARARNGMAGVLEEDARLTALFLWTLQSTKGTQTINGKVDHVDEEEGDEGEDEDETSKGKPKGYSLIFDVVRRFAQPLGISLPAWEGRIIESKKGMVRLLSIEERARQLFGQEGVKSAADWIERDPRKDVQQVLFPDLKEDRPPRIRGHGRGRRAPIGDGDFAVNPEREATTLDRVHAAMLLQASGQANALRELIKAEQDRGSDFLRLANALSALYPSSSEEKRLLDAMLQAAPR